MFNAIGSHINPHLNGKRHRIYSWYPYQQQWLATYIRIGLLDNTCMDIGYITIIILQKIGQKTTP